MTQGHQIEVKDDRARSRHNAYVDGMLAGFAVYRVAAERIISATPK